VGFAGIAYSFNDSSDSYKDLIAKKGNAFTGRDALNYKLTTSLFFVLALLPWLVLPLDLISVLLITTEIALFYVYSFSPFRLKERGVYGLVCDALYAHVIPATLATYTFLLAVGLPLDQYILLFLGIITWQFISGFRNIISHQIVDLDNDKVSKTNTWALTVGLQKSIIILKVSITLEVLAFLGFLVILFNFNNYTILCYFIYTIGALFAFAKAKHDNKTKIFTNIFLDDFYIKYLPIIVLLHITTIPTVVTGVLLIHILLFPNFIKNLFKYILNKIKNNSLTRTLFNSLYNENNYTYKLLKHVLLVLFYTILFVIIYYGIEKLHLDSQQFFFIQNLISKLLIVIIVIHGVSFFIFNKKTTLETIKVFIFQKSSAYNLAVFRILFFLFTIMNLVGPYIDSLKAWTYLPKTSQVSLPGISWLMKVIPISPAIYETMVWLAISISILGILGFKTKWTLKIFLPIAFYLWAVPCFYGKLNHNQIMLWIPIILAFSPCSDVLSIDNYIKKIKRNYITPRHATKYGFPLAAIWMHLGIIYCFSGFHKLWDTGLYWALSDNIINQIQLEWVENYDIILGYRVDKYPILLKAGALILIIFEIIYPIFLLKPFTRWLNFTGAWILHLTAGFLLNIDFVNLRMMHFSLINWVNVKKTIKSYIKFKKTTPQSEAPYAQISLNKLLKKPSYLIPLLLLAMNVLYGFAGINSWPFSAYPAYSAVVKDEISIIKLEACDSDGQLIDCKDLGKQQQFRWENIRPFEERIAETYNANDSTALRLQLKNYWELWANNVKGLENVTVVTMYLEKTKIAPELRNEILSSDYLGKVNIK
jgi:hypothetical protein